MHDVIWAICPAEDILGHPPMLRAIKAITDRKLQKIALMNAYHNAQAGFCHAIVHHHVEQNGGTRVQGWFVRGIEIRSEATPEPAAVHLSFHSIWRRPDGALFDLTPRHENEKNGWDGFCLFAEDPKRSVDVPAAGGMLWNDIRVDIKTHGKVYIMDGRRAGGAKSRIITDGVYEDWA